MRFRLGSVLLGLVGVASSGCDPAVPTQVLVIFEADAEVAAVARDLHIEVVNQDSETQTWDITFAAGAPMATSFPVTLPLVPRDGDASRTYAIVARVLTDGGVVVAQARVTSGYVERELREIRVSFTGDCLDQLCDATTTCRAGACASACAIPVARGAPFQTCRGADGGVRIVDAGLDAGGDGGSDGGLDTTSCDDAHAGALFCDGFEEPFLGAWAELRETNGALTRLEAPVYRGTRSLEARSTAPSAYVYARSDAIAGVADDLYVRLYTYVPSGQELVELNLIYAGEAGAPYGGLVLGLMDGGRVFARGLPADMQLVTPDAPVAWDRWVCLEAHVAMDGAAGYVELWIDGASRGRLDAIDTLPLTPVAGMNVGIGASTAAQPAVRVIVDEVVADTTRIGCD